MDRDRLVPMAAFFFVSFPVISFFSLIFYPSFVWAFHVTCFCLFRFSINLLAFSRRDMAVVACVVS